MILIAVAWIYVVGMVAIVEATSTQGSLLGAFVTFVMYGVLPLGIVMYLMLGPARRRVRRGTEGSPMPAGDSAAPESAAVEPGNSRHSAGDAVAAERKEP